MTLLTAALELADAGCSVVPVRPDGTKAPAGSWGEYQTRPAGPDELRAWFTNGFYDGLGVVCGAVSGHLELLEVEGRAIDLVPRLAATMADNGLSELWQRLCAGWLERSPSGGLHWLYRVEGRANANTRLARRPTPDGADILIETRGEGGFAVTSPSGGRSHPSGESWQLLSGGAATVPTITAEERDALWAICATFDEMPVVDVPRTTLVVPSSGLRPGDDYNARATWAEILEPHGWTRSRHLGANAYGWTRPGKTAREGISATTGRNDADNLYVFSTSTLFEAERAYSKFAAYTLLEHQGDYSAAAKALAAKGYGSTAEQPRPDLALLVADTTPTPATYTLTDDGNALRLIDTYGAHVRYCPEIGMWLHWDGHRWGRDTAGHIHELARSIARDLPSKDKAEAAHRRSSLSSSGLKGLVAVARTDPRIIAHLDQLDARAYELNTPAGVVDLRTGALRTPDPSALHTRSTPVSPDFDAPAPGWARFLADTFAGDPALTAYIRRLLGLSLIGEHLEQILPFGWGAGANGKSTLLNVVQGVVGIGAQGYSIPAPAELLLATQQRHHPTELARLSGARLVVASELEDGERFAESRIKMLTGGENIAARFMGQDFFSFRPTHTIWLLANDKPAVRAGGPAFWRRLRLLPFVHVVPPAERIAGLDHQLIESEGPAILAWIVRGAVDYLAHGLADPPSVQVATSAYERDQDTIARFVEECCETGPVASQVMRVRVAELRSRYETWCRQEGETAVTAKALTTALTARFGVVSERSNSARFYAGIRMTDVSPDFEETAASVTDEWWKR